MSKLWREPLDLDRMKIPHGEVRILVDRCKGCGFCIEYCPKDVLAFAEEFNRKGYHYPRLLRPEACIACNLCEMICPDFAIFCIPDTETERDEPGARVSA